MLTRFELVQWLTPAGVVLATAAGVLPPAAVFVLIVAVFALIGLRILAAALPGVVQAVISYQAAFGKDPQRCQAAQETLRIMRGKV